MSTIHVGKSAGTQIAAGAAILAAARTVDTKLIKDRLAAFERAQQAYAGAYAKVQQTETELEKVQAQFRAEQQGVVDALARALVADGQPLRNPFAGFGAATPGTLQRVTAADAAKALTQLIAAIRRGKPLGKMTLQAVQTAEKAARGMEQGYARMETLRAAARDARATRDAVAQTWESALGALKRAARAAADDGATTLFATLFDRPARAATKPAKPAPVAPPAPVVTPAPAPMPQPESAVS